MLFYNKQADIASRQQDPIYKNVRFQKESDVLFRFWPYLDAFADLLSLPRTQMIPAALMSSMIIYPDT